MTGSLISTSNKNCIDPQKSWFYLNRKNIELISDITFSNDLMNEFKEKFLHYLELENKYV